MVEPGTLLSMLQNPLAAKTGNLIRTERSTLSGFPQEGICREVADLRTPFLQLCSIYKKLQKKAEAVPLKCHLIAMS